MLDRSAEYQAAIVAAERRIGIRASVSVIDPDLAWEETAASGAAPWSKPEQLHDKGFDQPADYATLEPGRWVLDGSQRLIPDDPAALTGAVGVVGDVMCDEGGIFDPPVWAEERFSNVEVLQACSVYFSTAEVDGYPVDFKVEVLQGGTAYFTQEISGNKADHLSFDGFTVYNPDTIRLTVSKWSVPRRRMRIAEIVPGIYEAWDGRLLANLSVTQRGDVSCMSLPFNTCQLVLDNHTKRFEPRKKDNLFQSIEERQGIGIEIGVRLPGGVMEYKPCGVYYQKSPGWTTSDNGITITWDLVDIIGLVTDRVYIAPEVLPTTVGGWIASIVAQLGENFVSKYRVDPDYAAVAVTAVNRDAVTGKRCGDILRWACQASGTWPRAAADTGYLTVEPLWSEGGKITLREIENYPTMKANSDIAMLIFNLTDGTQINIPGTSASSGDTKTIANPFIHTREQALAAARMILATYGGNRLETVGRGDPAAEIGDVDTVWLDEASATTGRRIAQTLEITNGFLQNCKSTLLQANGAYLYEESALLTEDGIWTAPAGVSRLFVAIGQGGQGGMHGEDGVLRETERWGVNADTGDWGEKGSYESRAGVKGAAGAGGKIWFGSIDINEQQAFEVTIGRGGKASEAFGTAGEEGGETTFGPYSSAAGKVFDFGYTDVTAGGSYGRTGVPAPVNGSADGAEGGAGGEAGVGGWSVTTTVIPGSGRKIYYSYWDPKKPAGKGKPAKDGADGFVLIYWDKEDGA